MTDEELEKKFAHIHDRFDYLMGQVESISKSDLFTAVEKTAETVNRTARKFAKINDHLESITKEVRFLNDRIDHDLELRIQRRKRQRDRKRLDADRVDLSLWEMMHS